MGLAGLWVFLWVDEMQILGVHDLMLLGILVCSVGYFGILAIADLLGCLG